MDSHRFDDMLYRSARMHPEARRMFSPVNMAEPMPLVMDESSALKTLRSRSDDDCSVVTDPNCNKNVQSSSYSLLIALAVIIPVVAFGIALLFLHRRHVRKQRQEDMADRHASLDFGLGEVHRPKKGEKQGMRVAESEFGDEKRLRQLSMDLSSPYLLPPELQGSQDTLRSLSRAADQTEDPYRPVTQYLAETGSQYGGRRGHDGSSTYTGSSGPSRRDHSAAPSTRTRISQTTSPMAAFPIPPRMNSLATSTASDPSDPFQSHFDSPTNSIHRSPIDSATTIPTIQLPAPIAMPVPRKGISPVATQVPSRGTTPEQLSMPAMPAMPAEQPTIPEMPGAPVIAMPVAQRAIIEDANDRASSNYGDGIQVTPPSPGRNESRGQRYSMDVPPEEFVQAGLGAPGFDAKRLSLGFRPLPPDSLTADVEDPEMRANRIRSFYKEYFDDSKPMPAGQYIEDYDDGNYMGDNTYYDPRANNFVMPYAEPVTRRAMTPPPQAQRYMGQGGPPRAPFMGGQGRPRNGSLAGPRAPFMSNGPRPHSSASNRGGPGPRAFSSASQRPGQPRGHPLPPPEALTTLPTPAKLRDDSFALFGASDFAPPTTFRDRQHGRSESPMGGERRPYSPAVPAFQPLVSSFDDIAPLPSPHLLRKSTTFTSLDFAPPRKFTRDDGSGSDAGSIRSTRSGVSQMQNDAIRRGAYRLSRLPPDAVPTKDHMNDVLKPSWGMRSGGGGAL